MVSSDFKEYPDTNQEVSFVEPYAVTASKQIGAFDLQDVERERVGDSSSQSSNLPVSALGGTSH